VLGLSHGRELRAVVEPYLRVAGDRRLLERVLDNLVGNAFKFSPADAPVAVRAFARGAEAVVEVEDRGPGIPAEEHNAIFQGN